MNSLLCCLKPKKIENNIHIHTPLLDKEKDFSIKKYSIIIFKNEIESINTNNYENNKNANEIISINGKESKINFVSNYDFISNSSGKNNTNYNKETLDIYDDEIDIYKDYSFRKKKFTALKSPIRDGYFFGDEQLDNTSLKSDDELFKKQKKPFLYCDKKGKIYNLKKRNNINLTDKINMKHFYNNIFKRINQSFRTTSSRKNSNKSKYNNLPENSKNNKPLRNVLKKIRYEDSNNLYKTKHKSFARKYNTLYLFKGIKSNYIDFNFSYFTNERKTWKQNDGKKSNYNTYCNSNVSIKNFSKKSSQENSLNLIGLQNIKKSKIINFKNVNNIDEKSKFRHSTSFDYNSKHYKNNYLNIKKKKKHFKNETFKIIKKNILKNPFIYKEI